MPCGVLARGIRQSAPHTSPMAFNDAINNSPCAKEIISTANGVSLASHAMCLPHLQAKLGSEGLKPPYVTAA